MRLPKFVTASVLLMLGIALTAGNVWYTAARSTIPLQLDGIITSKEIRGEKHPGRDDVFLLKFSARAAFQVDDTVYRALSVGERLHKVPWSRQLHHDSQKLSLDWSQDFRGMRLAMPVILLIFLATILSARPNPHSHARHGEPGSACSSG